MSCFSSTMLTEMMDNLRQSSQLKRRTIVSICSSKPTSTSKTNNHRESKENYEHNDRRGVIRLKNAVVGIDDDDDCMFTITADNKAFHFQASDLQERENWITLIQKCVDTSPYLTLLSTTGSAGPFTRKLAELDAYLQLMLDSIRNLEIKISNDSSEERDAAQKVVNQTKKFADSIKYSILLLQMAEAHIDQSSSMPDLSILQNQSDHQPETSITSVPKLENTLLNSSDDDEDKETLFEDDLDDDFFDAMDSFSQIEEAAAADQTTKTEPTAAAVTSVQLVNKHQVSHSIWDKYDACCEQEEVEEPKVDTSIFMHLLSQVKIGMDLTRVTLPTFILERRSFLEMIADFLAHPDFFTQIAQMNTAEQRMVQVVKWYLSAFHAGRKTIVPKKPYNPILGEVFLCYYSLGGEKSDVTKIGGDNRSPIPWADNSDVCFIAEQVSHHPPVSAYYAEHIPSNIEIEGCIWTKSRFLGISVSVHMVGLTKLRLLRYGEEYEMTFPSAYGRSIFSVPWFELGGKVYIECRKTGFRSNIEFETKPFYGGKTNRVTGTICHDRRIIYNLEGEWNDRIYIRRPETNETSIFFDVRASPTIAKRVKSIRDQDDNESRRLWRDVTLFLCTNHLDKATEAKRKLEDMQRAHAAQRAESNSKWTPKHFCQNAHNVVDGVTETGWAYCRPLSKRKK